NAPTPVRVAGNPCRETQPFPDRYRRLLGRARAELVHTLALSDCICRQLSVAPAELAIALSALGKTLCNLTSSRSTLCAHHRPRPQALHHRAPSLQHTLLPAPG